MLTAAHGCSPSSPWPAPSSPWGAAQWPYILPESLTFSAAAAPTGTLAAVLTAVALAVAIVVPGFILLYVLHQKGLLPQEGADDNTAADPAGLRTQTHDQTSQ